MEFLGVVPNPLYRVHNPIGIKYLTRLRVGLSHLREHKYNHNFLDTNDPYCSCDRKSVESNDHYLLRCPNHIHHRNVLFENLNRIDDNLHFSSDSVKVQTLLYGENIFSDHVNKRILESNIKFVIDSNCFNESLIITIIWYI